MGKHDSKEKSHKKKKKDKKKKEKKKAKRESKHKDGVLKEADMPTGVASHDRSSSDVPEIHKIEQNVGSIAENTEKLVREDWMVKPMARSRAKTPPQEIKGSKIEDKGWGVALDEAKAARNRIQSKNEGSTPTVGDGGASWRLKALKRMQMRAENDGLSLREVAVSRGVDLSQLTDAAMRTTAAAAMSHLSEGRKRAAKERARQSDQKTSMRSQYMEDVRSDRSRMKKVDVDEHLSLHPRKQFQSSDRNTDGLTTKTAAVAINNFDDDGSFMKQFHLRKADRQGNESWQPDNEATAKTQSSKGSKGETSGGHEQQHLRSSAEKVVAGNQSVAAMLRKRLGSSGKSGKAIGDKWDEVVQLPLVDSKGRAAPGAFGRDVSHHSSYRRAKEDNFNADGTRRRYFDGDDDVDLGTLVKRSRHGDDAIDMDKAMADTVMKSKNYRQAHFDADAEYDFDAGIDLQDRSRSKRRKRSGDPKSTSKSAQVADYKKLTSVEESCVHCFSSSSNPRHLVVSIATTTYLMLPANRRLVSGHCLILPLEHVPSTRQLDENVLIEMRNFKKALIHMFHSQDKQVLFLETALQLRDFNQHAAIHCIPVSPQVMSKAPLYFKNAIDDATEDWAQHHHKRCISTKEKGLQRSIPENFPYFHVEFGLGDGFVHVIDDESKFDKNLGWKVLCGLMKLPAEKFYQKSTRDGRVIEDDLIAQFASAWSTFDWTLALK